MSFGSAPIRTGAWALRARYLSALQGLLQLGRLAEDTQGGLRLPLHIAEPLFQRFQGLQVFTARLALPFCSCKNTDF